METKAKKIKEAYFKEVYDYWYAGVIKMVEVQRLLGMSQTIFYRKAKQYKGYTEGTMNKPHWLI